MTVDPNNRVLRYSSMRVAVAIGAANSIPRSASSAGSEGIPEGARNQSQQLATALASPRCFLAEQLSISGERVPRVAERRYRSPLTEVWAHINLGRIFDITGRRERR